MQTLSEYDDFTHLFQLSFGTQPPATLFPILLGFEAATPESSILNSNDAEDGRNEMMRSSLDEPLQL